jgi:probable O-glycosylation ligase (exosortase A-associated)
MLRSLFMLAIYVSFLGAGVVAPFVATLGYVWVDIFQPQLVSYVIILNDIPVAMVMGIAALLAYFGMDRRFAPPITAELMLQITMAVWITFTTIFAAAGSVAWDKWDWAFKTVAFTTFVPFVIRSRVQIEAMVQVFVLSMAANFIPFGAKVLISGGGYGRNLGLQTGNAGLSEGGQLSTACLMAVPLVLHLGSHARLLPRLKAWPVVYWGMAALAIATAVGTYERSALIGMVVLALYVWFRSKNKLLYGFVIACVGLVIAYQASSGYAARMSTIETYQSDSSAYVRLLIWKWTMGFAASHPLGGGFQAYFLSAIDVPAIGDSAEHVEFGRAYHSSYFEILGEQGYPGFAMFFAIVGLTLFHLRRSARLAKEDPEFQWVVSLCNSIECGLAVFLTSGAFVSIAFTAMPWYFFAISASINGYMWHAKRLSEPVAHQWRPPVNGLAPTASPVTSSWRDRAGAATSRRTMQ